MIPGIRAAPPAARIPIQDESMSPQRPRPPRFVLALQCFLLTVTLIAEGADPPLYRWYEVTVDKIDIGYGIQLSDVDGDGRTDIVLADKSTIQWYQSPDWKKHIIAKDLTKRDNVCVSARDIDGDGKCEIAVGGQWNFRETLKDGAVFYLIPPEDRTRPWEPVKLYNEPSTHRMHWIRTPSGRFSLVVKPLRGRGSANGDGPGLRILEYIKPPDPRAQWRTELVSDSLHLSHNFHPVNWDDDPEEEIIVAAKEGVWHFDRRDGEWRSRQLTRDFAGEIRDGLLPDGRRFIVTVEPMHGNKSAVYVEPPKEGDTWKLAAVLDPSLKDGHALACADYLGIGSDQIVVGWRAMHPKGTPGIKFFTPVAPDGTKWREQQVSGAELAVEDIKAGDLNGDGKPDIVAAARQTKNLKIFFSGSATTTPTFQAAKWTRDWWMPRHEQKLAELEKQGEVDLLMVGDSITHGWERGGRATWDRYYAKRKAFNLGFSGDRTEHVLWRLANGAVDGISPKLAVVMIGTNNTGQRQDPAEDTAAGVKAIIDDLGKRLPRTRVLLLAIFPREPHANGKQRRLNSAINELIAKFADGRKVFYLDVNKSFLKEDGRLTKDIMPDFLHPNAKGYEIWAKAMEPTLERLMGE